MFRWNRLIICAALAIVASATGAFAQRYEAPGRDGFGPGGRSSVLTQRINAGTVGIVSGGVDGTYIRIAADLASVLDREDLRVLAVVGRGSMQNLRDIMFLKGIDIGIVQMDARAALAAENLTGAAERRLRYIAKLYNEEVHILASRDVPNLAALQGRKVNIDRPGSGTNLTARNIFAKLKISPDFTELDQTSSYAALKSGEIVAAIYVAGRPVRAISDFRDDGRFHLLGIPFQEELSEAYLPATLAATDYPRLLNAEQSVETLAVGSILAAFNWPAKSERHQRVARFVDAFFSRFEEFRKPGRHPKWKDVSLSASVPGWQRLEAAQAWLDRQSDQAGLRRGDGMQANAARP